MTPKSHPIILTIGTPEFQRYVIVAKGTVSAEYWTGEGWTNDVGEALLYAQRGIAWRDVEKILAEQS